jgi:hypothetical protein
MLWIIFLIVIIYLMKHTFDFEKFGYYLGISESGGNYQASNGIAYGKYQFTPATIQRISNDLNMDTPSINDFLSNPNMQDLFFKTYVQEILDYINKNNLNSFVGQPITGKKNNINTTINIYGLVAGAWLSGEGGLYNFLVHGSDKNDGYTYISDYIAKFSQIFNNNNIV